MKMCIFLQTSALDVSKCYLEERAPDVQSRVTQKAMRTKRNTRATTVVNGSMEEVSAADFDEVSRYWPTSFWVCSGSGSHDKRC